MDEQKSDYESFIQAFTQWATTRDDIRAVRLIGSRTHLQNPSRWVDLDIELYTTNPLTYRLNQTWLEDCYPVWLNIPDDRGEYLNHWSARFRSWFLFTTLEGGLAVDFLVVPVMRLIWENWKSRLRGTASPVPEQDILVDKEGRLARWGAIPSVTMRYLPKPSQDEYLFVVMEFFGVVDRGVRYLGRGYHIEARRELGEVLRRHIKQMMMWHRGMDRNWEGMADWRLHHVDQWANPDHLQALQACFATYDLTDTKRAVIASVDFFSTIAQEVADSLDYPYPHNQVQHVIAWMMRQFEMIDDQ